MSRPLSLLRSLLPLALPLLWSTIAVAGEALQVDAGDEVVVISLKGVHAMSLLHPKGDRVEIDLDASGHGRVDLDDETVKRAEWLSDPPRLSIALHHSKHSTELTANNARIESKNGSMIITLPRNPHRRLSTTSDVVAGVVEEKHAVKKPAAPVVEEEVKHVAKPEPVKAAEAPVEPVHVAKAAPKAVEPAPVHAAKTVAVEPAKVAKAEPTPAAVEEPAVAAAPVAVAAAVEPVGIPDPTSGRNPIWITIGILGVSVALLFWLQRRKQKTPDTANDPLRLIAQRPLSSKSKMVLFETHGREILVAIGEGRPVLLGKWKVERRVTEIDMDDRAEHADNDNAEPETMAELETYHEPKPRAASRRTAAPTAASPSVAGILKLRGPQATVRPPARPAIDDNQEDLDAEWARELISATTKRRVS